MPRTQLDYLNSFQLSGIQKIILIENKTNYDAYLQREITPDELVIYQGGFLSPNKRRFLNLLKQSAGANIPVFFWADIDLGGFRMFEQLQEVFPNSIPMRMSEHVVSRFQAQGLVRSNVYLDRLRRALDAGRYPLFSNVMEKILELGVTIEQEVFYS